MDTSKSRQRAGKPAGAPATVAEYIEQAPEAARSMLGELRATVLAAAPGASEVLSYQVPTFRYEGRGLVAIGAARKHCSLYPMSGSVMAAFRDELAGYSTSKGTVRFPLGEPLPAALIERMVRARIAENAQRGAG